MLVPMAKVEIIGPKSLFFDVVSLLHEQGTLHIEDLSKKIEQRRDRAGPMEIQAQRVKVYDQLDELLIRVRAILKALNEPDGRDRPQGAHARVRAALAPDARGAGGRDHDVIDDVEEKTADLAALHTVGRERARAARALRADPRQDPAARQADRGHRRVRQRRAARRAPLQGRPGATADRARQDHEPQCEIVSTDMDEDTTAAIVVYSRQYAEPVHKFLAMENVNQIRLPQDFQDMPFDVAYETIRQRRAELPAELEEDPRRARSDVDASGM